MQPIAYNRAKDFADDFPDETDGNAINRELDDAATSINETRDALALIQRDDGGLQNGIVIEDSLDPTLRDSLYEQFSQDVDERTAEAKLAALQAEAAAAAADASADRLVGFRWRSDGWGPIKQFKAKDVVTVQIADEPGGTPHLVEFITMQDHLSGLTFDADRAAGLWTIYQGIARAEAAAPSGSDLIGWKQIGSGAAARTAQVKMREHLSIGDYPTSGTDNVSQFQAAVLQGIPLGSSRVVEVPEGDYYGDLASIDMAGRDAEFRAMGRVTYHGTAPPESARDQVFRIIDFFLTLDTDYRGETLDRGMRRSVRVRKPTKESPFETETSVESYSNTTSMALALTTLANAARTWPEERDNLFPHIQRFANWLLAFQFKDPTTARYGGFMLAPSSTEAGAFGTGLCGRALLAAWKVTRTPEYLMAALIAGDFCLMLQSPNARYQQLYGVSPISDAPENAGFKGFCDQVVGNDRIHITSTCWSIGAALFLKELGECSGYTQYTDAAIAARDWYAGGIIRENGVGVYDFFALRGAVSTYVSVTWPNRSSSVFADGRWHRLGDSMDGSTVATVGTDQPEYGLMGLLDLGYDKAKIEATYRWLTSLPNVDTGPFGQKYDGRYCWNGFFRLDAPQYGGESFGFGTYYDGQGAGTLLPLKLMLALDHFAQGLHAARRVVDNGALMDENFETRYSDSTPPGLFVFYTKGVIVLAKTALAYMYWLGRR